MSFVIYELRYSNIVRDLQSGIRHSTLNLTELTEKAIRWDYIFFGLDQLTLDRPTN